MKERLSWFIKIWDENAPDIFGVGECAPLPGLSVELNDSLDDTLQAIVGRLNASFAEMGDLHEAAQTLHSLNTWIERYVREVSDMPSLRFAFETALLDLHLGGRRLIFDNDFVKGKPVPINGLIWMGGMDFMLQQVEIKIRDGFRCVKLKVGGLDFERECDVLQYIRRKYFRDEIVIRLDANGALKPDDVQFKLKELSKFKVHSIEQPLKKGSPMLAELCRDTPIPIALDEELTGVKGKDAKAKLLDDIRPQYIILKPSLHGGLAGAAEWIDLANERNMGWWVTSALESNVGLNAIAQFTSQYQVTIPQGLGTGQIYENNFPSPLQVTRDTLVYGKGEWDLEEIGPPKENLFIR